MLNIFVNLGPECSGLLRLNFEHQSFKTFKINDGWFRKFYVFDPTGWFWKQLVNLARRNLIWTIWTRNYHRSNFYWPKLEISWNRCLLALDLGMILYLTIRIWSSHPHWIAMYIFRRVNKCPDSHRSTLALSRNGIYFKYKILCHFCWLASQRNGNVGLPSSHNIPP